MEIDQEIFNMMLAKSMHQIARIEFRNSKFPYARGLCPLPTPARGLCPLDPRQGASPLEPPSLVHNLGPPFPATGSAPVWHHMKVHIFLITHAEFYSWKIFHLEATNENVHGYGEHDWAYTVKYRHLQCTELLCTFTVSTQILNSHLWSDNSSNET